MKNICSIRLLSIPTRPSQILETIDAHLWTSRSAHLAPQLRAAKQAETEGLTHLLRSFAHVTTVRHAGPAGVRFFCDETIFWICMIVGFYIRVSDVYLYALAYMLHL